MSYIESAIPPNIVKVAEKFYPPHKDRLVNSVKKNNDNYANNLPEHTAMDLQTINIIKTVSKEQFAELFEIYTNNFDVFTKHVELYNISREFGFAPDYDNFAKFLKEHSEFGKLAFNQITLLMAWCSIYKRNTGASGIDFASLYPSIIMAYNMCPSKACKDARHAQEVVGRGYSVHYTQFPFQTATDNKPRIIESYFVRHTYVAELDPVQENPGIGAGLDYLKKTNLGLYPRILLKLKNFRSALKKPLKEFAHQKEHLQKIGKDKDENGKETPEYSLVCFEWNRLDSKQKAIKVMMNTFYGESGNKISPMFMLGLAGGITTNGQILIKRVKHLVIGMQCIMHYGDTDSLYISVPRYLFNQINKEYCCSKITVLEYATKVVEIMFLAMKEITKIVNDYLESFVGNKFLSMAYEEVLYPVAFFAKKNYFGIAHEGIVNFKPNDLFIRGISVIKRGTSEILKKVGFEVMWEAMNLDDYRGFRELTETKIMDLFKRDWNVEDFIIVGKYKPDKQNVCMQTFANRMADHPDCIPPKPYEPFKYVQVKKYPYKYDITGKVIALTKGDIMEYATYAKKNNMEIDLKVYMDSGITKQFARYLSGSFGNMQTNNGNTNGFSICHISHHDDFSHYNEKNAKDQTVIKFLYEWDEKTKSDIYNPVNNLDGFVINNNRKMWIIDGIDQDGNNILLENDADNADKMEIDSQTAYLEAFISKFTNKYKSKGKLYQSTYKLCTKLVNGSVKKNSTADISAIVELNKTIQAEVSKINYNIVFVNAYAKRFNKLVINNNLLIDLHSVYCNTKKNSYYLMKKNYLSNKEQELIKELDKYSFYIKDINNRKDQLVLAYNEKFRKLLDLDNIGLEKNAEIPKLEELIFNLSKEKLDEYYKLQQELVEKTTTAYNDSPNNDNTEELIYNYNDTLLRLTCVLKEKYELEAIKSYVIERLTNTHKTNMTTKDINNLAHKLSS
jgi:hypothetical protein